MGDSDFINWHGWPPQVWRGSKWHHVEPAKLAVEQAAEIERLRVEVDYWRWLAEMRSGSEGG